MNQSSHDHLQESIDFIFENAESKYNTSVILTEEDKKNGLKIWCKEPYAQEMYNALIAYERKLGNPKQLNKDLVEGQVYKVCAKTISYQRSEIYADEVTTGTNVCVPFKEYSKSLDSLANGESREFFVTIYRATNSGEFFGSEKKALGVSYKEELFAHQTENTWFDVKIIKLIKGGYLALYKKEIECFIPGSHAAANVVHNFGDLLGKTIPVMVDNYDASNNLFILSYKKYVTHSMSTMITELQFDKEYEGVLTNKPYDFGIFVEVEGYYTGLIHKTEFENYEELRKTLRSGDKLKVYVKDVTSKGDQYRIVFTLNQNSVNNEKVQWQNLRNRTENQSFKYSINENKNSISIDIDGDFFEVSLKRKDLDQNLTKYPLVKVFKVDPINKSLKFEFVKEN
jgi:predicted RNA-binding protein (virulence factor B family)